MEETTDFLANAIFPALGVGAAMEPWFYALSKSQCVVVGVPPPGEEVGEALDMLSEATGKEEAADSPTAASWNCSVWLANEWYFSKVIQGCYNIPALPPSGLPVSQTRKLPKPRFPEQSSA